MFAKKPNIRIRPNSKNPHSAQLYTLCQGLAQHVERLATLTLRDRQIQQALLEAGA